MFPTYQPPSPYTGELYGIEYLLGQSGVSLSPQDVDQEIDEGFEEMEEDLVSCQRTDELQDPIDLPPPSDNEENDEVGLYVPMSKF